MQIADRALRGMNDGQEEEEAGGPSTDSLRVAAHRRAVVVVINSSCERRVCASALVRPCASVDGFVVFDYHFIIACN